MSPPPDIPPPQGECQLSIVVPTYHEAANVGELAGRLFAALAERGDLADAELIIVDDDSGDGIERVLADGPHRRQVRLLVRRGERGLASAVLFGLDHARGRYVVVMDADLSHPPEMVPELVRPLQEGRADMVIGSRYAPGGSTDGEWGAFRKLNSRFATWLARPFARVTDPMAGFFAFERKLLGQAGYLNPIGYKIGLELLVKCHCRRIVDVPIHFTDRRRGQSKLTFAEQLRYIEHLSRLYDYRFPRLAPVLKFLIVTVLGALGGYAWVAVGQVAGAAGAIRDGDGAISRLWLVAAYWPAVAFNLLAYWRYLKQMRDFVPIRRPAFDFVVISLFEWVSYTATLLAVQMAPAARLLDTAPWWFLWLWVPFTTAFATRFLLRKLAGHDIRGLPTIRDESPAAP